QKAKRLQHGPAKENETLAVVRIVAFLAAGQTELVQAPPLGGVIAFKVFRLLDEVNRHVRVGQGRSPEGSRHRAVADGYGKPVLSRCYKDFAVFSAIVERKNDDAFMTPARQGSG